MLVLHQSQAAQPAGQGAGSSARGLAEDYRRMVYADSRETVEHACASFLRKWRHRCKAVISSFEEAGDELFIFFAVSPIAVESTPHH